MTFAVSTAAALAVLAAVALCLVLRRLAARDAHAEPDLEWCRNFSVAKYRPMERLFSEDDYEFLAAQPGFSREMSRQLQATRRRLFRRYLRLLSRDFQRLTLTVKMLVVQAAEDRPDLATALLRQRVTFLYALGVVHVRLALQPFGVAHVDVRPLVTALEAMRDQLRAIASTPQAVTSVG